MRGMVIGALMAVITAAAASAQPAPPDLTGTWHGKASCAGLEGGTKLKRTFDVTSLVVHHNSAERITARADLRETSTGLTRLFNGLCGLVQGVEGRPGEGRGVLVFAGVPQLELVALDVKKIKTFAPTRAGASGKLKGRGAIAENPGAVLTCTWTLERRDLADPGPINPCFNR